MFKNQKTEEQYNRIMALCKAKGITKYELTQGIGKTTSLFSDIAAGRIGISGEVIRRCAEYFGVSVDYIMNGTEPPPAATRPITDEDIQVALFGGAGKVTDEMWEEVLNFVDYVKTKHKKRKK